jgi:hypothetical protein
MRSDAVSENVIHSLPYLCDDLSACEAACVVCQEVAVFLLLLRQWRKQVAHADILFLLCVPPVNPVPISRERLIATLFPETMSHHVLRSLPHEGT